MIENDKKIRKGLPAARSRESYQVLHDIVIPAGTILRGNGGEGVFSCQVGSVAKAEFTITPKPGEETPGFRKVIA